MRCLLTRNWTPDTLTAFTNCFLSFRMTTEGRGTRCRQSPPKILVRVRRTRRKWKHESGAVAKNARRSPEREKRGRYHLPRHWITSGPRGALPLTSTTQSGCSLVVFFYSTYIFDASEQRHCEGVYPRLKQSHYIMLKKLFRRHEYLATRDDNTTIP